MVEHERYIEGSRFNINDGAGCFSGMNIGVAPEIVREYPNGWVLLRRKAYNGWAGVGMTATYPTAYFMVQIKNDRVIKAYRGEFGRKWKNAIEEMQAVININK